MREEYVLNNGKNFKVLVPENIRERQTGMKKFETPDECKCDGMLFKFDHGGFEMTMEGMTFPLFMIFLDGSGNALKTVKAEPTKDYDSILSPRESRYCLELVDGAGFNPDVPSQITSKTEVAKIAKEILRIVKNYGH